MARGKPQPGQDLFGAMVEDRLAKTGPMAARMLESICGDDPARWAEAEIGASAAIRARIAFWTGVTECVGTDKQSVGAHS